MATTGAPAGGVGATPSTVSKITFKSGTAAVPTANLDDPDSVVMTANHVLAQGLGHTGWVSVVGGNATCAATLNGWILSDTFDGKPDLLSDRANWIPTDAVYSQQWEDLVSAGGLKVATYDDPLALKLAVTEAAKVFPRKELGGGDVVRRGQFL